MDTVNNYSALLIPQLSKGDKLYHYTSAAGLQGICNKEFWVTDSHFLNDKSELQIGTSIYCEVIKKRVKDRKTRNHIISRMKATMPIYTTTGKIGEDIAHFGSYILSFSLDRNSSLMWSQYSDFMGYCMEFDYDSFISSIDFNSFVWSGKVIYDHDIQYALMERVLAVSYKGDYGEKYSPTWDMLSSLTDDEMVDRIISDSAICEAYNMFFKLPCFSGENEYRIVFPCIHDNGEVSEDEYITQHFRIMNGCLIPFVKIPLKNLDSLKSIMVGPKNTQDIAMLGLEYFFRNKKIPVRLEKSEMPLRY